MNSSRTSPRRPGRPLAIVGRVIALAILAAGASRPWYLFLQPAAPITANLTSLQSDDHRRDGQLSRQGIPTSQFPTAAFTLSSPLDLGSVPADGATFTATAAGQLMLHGVTKDVTIPIKAKRSGDVVVVSGSLPIVFADYGISKPNSFAVLSIADQGTMEFQVFFRHA